MVTITRKNLEKLLHDVKGTTFATITVATEPKVKAAMKGRIVKWSKVNVCLGFVYANSVNNQRKREGNDADFVASSRRWGIRMEHTPLVYHKEKVYLETKVEKSIDCQYYLDKTPVEYEKISEYLPKRKETKQSVIKPIIIRDYNLESIKMIKMNKTVFKVI